MPRNFTTMNINTANTCVCSSEGVLASRPCGYCRLRQMRSGLVMRERSPVNLRDIEVLERPEDEYPILYCFKAHSLYNVFARMQEMFGFQGVQLYWNWHRVDYERSFEFYGMGNPVQFVMELDEFPQVIRALEISDDDTESDELALDSPVLQSGKTFEQVLTNTTEYEPFVKVVEDICCLFYQFKIATNAQQATVALGCFVRSITGRANVYFLVDLTNKFLNDFGPSFTLQSDGHWTNTISDVYENYSRCKDSELSRRLKAFFNHLIMHCVYHKLNIEVDSEIFDKLEKKKIRPNLLNCFSFLDACASLITFLLKQGRQVMLTGDVDHFFIDSDSLSVWTLKAKRLKMQSEFLNNPSAAGLDIHMYLHELTTTIAESKNLVKYMKVNTPEGRYFHTMQFDLTAIENRYLSVTAAQSMRKAPLGLVIYGESGIGKSSVMSILGDFDARRRGRCPERNFWYTVTAETEYYENFKSNMHTIIIDDAAIHNPSKIQGVDPTIADIMRINNMVPWCAPQAAIEDKGKTPVLCNLCMVSTNVADLNIPLYYKASYAAMRRLKFRIEPVVREDYVLDSDGVSLDPSKCTANTGYDDFWSFNVSVAVRSGGGMCGTYEFYKYFRNMPLLLQWLGEVSDQHDLEQERALKNCSSYDITICEGCLNPSTMCLCDNVSLQGDKIPISKQVEEVCVEDDFAQQFLLRNGNLDLFREVCSNVKAWRDDDVSRGTRRVYTINNSLKFKEKLKGHTEELFLDYYAYEELPFLLQWGWTDVDILHDFYRFSVFVREHSDLDDMLNLSEVFTEENITHQCDSSIGSFLDILFKLFVSLYFYSRAFRKSVLFVSKVTFIRKLGMKFVRPRLLRSDNQLFFAKKLGQTIDNKLGGGAQYVGYILALLGVGSMIAIACSFWKRFEPVDVVAKDASGKTDVSVSPEIQVLRSFGSYPKRAAGDEKINVWAVPERSVTTVDFVPNLCRDLVGFERKLGRNVLAFEALETEQNGTWKYNGVLTVLSNEHFLTNSHSLPIKGNVRMVVYLGRNHLVSPKIEFELSQSQIERVVDRDIAVVSTHNFPALFNDISRNFVRLSYNGVYDGFYFVKNFDGSVIKHQVLNIRKVHLTRMIQEHYFDMDVFQGTVSEPTLPGYCGSPLIAITGYGPVVVGFHAIYDRPNTVYAAKFSYEDFKHFSNEMVVQVGKIPIGDIEVYQAPKSYVDYHESGNLMYHGELKIFRARPKHNVVSSELASQVYGKTLNGVLLEERLCGPVMDSWRAQQTGLKEFLQPVKNMNEALLQKISDVWVQHILTGISNRELDLISPCCIDVAVNGVPGMAYVDSIKRSTSMGFPYYVTKKKFLEQLDDDYWPDGVRFNDEVEKTIAEWMQLLKSGERLHAVFGANLKDEPVSFKKYEACKTRIFFSCPAELLVIVRMFYLGFARVVQRNRDLFWVAIGLNTTSPEWDDLFVRLSKFGLDTAIAGDHVFYDKKVKMLIMYYVMDSINRVCVASGNFTNEMRVMMEVLKHELMNPTVDFFGMLITLLGGEVSGHQLTTIFNCVLNVFYLMYAYAEAGYDVEDFFEHVVGVILGDDHVLCVSPDRSEFHHTHIQQVLNGLGLGYTMADKSSESKKYISLYETTFLKRTFFYDVSLGVHVGRLEFDSIVKMITVQVRSRKVMLSTQLAQAISSACSEMFLYGESAFNEFCDFINSLSKSESLKLQMLEFPILTYGEYKKRFWNTSNVKAYDTGLQSQKSHHISSYCLRSTSVLRDRKRVELCGNLARAFPEIYIYKSMELDTKQHCKVWQIKLTSKLENNRLSKTNLEINSIQSEHPVTEGSEVISSQQTQFVNETVPESLELGLPHDKVASSLITNAHLADFLSRPTKIATFTWTENLGPGTLSTINPWSLFFNNSSIKNKLEGFGYIRCKLHLKFTINASQFYYGSIGAFYTPMSGVVQDTTGSGYGYAPGFQVLQSQKPHVWLDPQTTSSAVMELPFLYNRNFLNATSNQSMLDMGKIDFTQFAALRSANGVTTTGVNIVTYAWATNVELTGLTSNAVLQSKKEYVGNGQISGPASTVANVARRLNDAPVIGPFAKATEVAAGAIGSIASMFGYTNVPNVRDVEPFKSLPFHTLASSEISEPINKLGLQPKQEIAIAHQHVGDPMADPLQISNFVQRESFLCGSLWATTSAEDTILFTSHVTPQLYEKNASSNYSIYDTPMAYASRLFSYWRGDLIFRFKIIKTQYHRGRINISWDPNQNNSANMPGYGNPRVQNIIFDLEDDDEIEVRVPYMQELPFVKLRDGATTYAGPYWSNGPSPTFTAGNGLTNGTIQVRVINRLTAPEASSDVDILVFVRAAENFELASPAEIRDKTFMALQSKKVFCFGESSVSDSDVYNEVFGEKICSLRQLLHRSSKSSTEVIPKNTDWAGNQMIFTIPFQRLPRPYGYTDEGAQMANATVGVGTFAFNYCRVHPILWIKSCFLGYKGSTNWNFNTLFNDGNATRPLMSTAVCRNIEPSNNKPFAYSTVSTNSTSQLMRNFNTGSTIDRQGNYGMALTNQYTQTGLAVNVPYYSRYKFQINDNNSAYSLTDFNKDEAHVDWFEFSLKRGVPTASTTDAGVLVDVFVGTGPDFDVVFFINCPVYTYLVPPTASVTG